MRKSESTRWGQGFGAACSILVLAASGANLGCESDPLAGGGTGAESTDEGGTDEGGTEGGLEPSFSALYDDYFAECGSCHAPNAPGRTNGIEETLNFSTRQTAYSSITTGTASGLTGNQAGCNGVPFIGSSAADSLVMAAIHSGTRSQFDLPSHPSCDATAIADMTLKVGFGPPSDFVTALGQWIDDGAPNN